MLFFASSMHLAGIDSVSRTSSGQLQSLALALVSEEAKFDIHRSSALGRGRSSARHAAFMLANHLSNTSYVVIFS